MSGDGLPSPGGYLHGIMSSVSGPDTLAGGGGSCSGGGSGGVSVSGGGVAPPSVNRPELDRSGGSPSSGLSLARNLNGPPGSASLFGVGLSAAAAAAAVAMGAAAAGGGSSGGGAATGVGTTRRTSRVWRYFTLVDNCHYMCRLCSFVGAYTNTTNMRKHIQHHHPERFQDILDHTRHISRPNAYASLRVTQQQQQHSGTSQPLVSLGGHHRAMSKIAMNTSVAAAAAAALQVTTTVTQPSLPPPLPPLGQASSSPSGGGGLRGAEARLVPSPMQSPSLVVSGPLGPPPPPPPPPSLLLPKGSPYSLYESSKSDSESKPKFKANSYSSSSDLWTDFDSKGSTNEDRSGDGASTTEESMFPDLVAPPETEQAVSPNPTTPSQQKPESYQLRHNNHMTLVLESLAQDEAFMDVTLTAQGRSIRAHKSVLSAVSPYFRGVLCENPCQHPIIIMPRDVRFDELQSIITYIYKGEMTVAAEDLSSLLKTAEILQVTGLTPADPQAAAAAASASFNPQFSSGFTSSETPRTSKPRVYHTTPKLQDTINPTDFMDMDMTCVKEEVMSGDEDDDEQDTSYHSSQILAHSKGSEPQPTSINQTSSSSSMTTTTPSTQTRYSSDADNPDPGPSPVKGEEEEDLISCQIPMSREEPEPFVCPHCKDTARGFDSLTLHLKTKHPSKLNFPCSCGRVYIRHGKYVDHIKVCKSGS